MGGTVRTLLNKLKHKFEENISFIMKYKTSKLSMSCLSKDKMNWDHKTNVTSNI